MFFILTTKTVNPIFSVDETLAVLGGSRNAVAGKGGGIPITTAADILACHSDGNLCPQFRPPTPPTCICRTRHKPNSYKAMPGKHLRTVLFSAFCLDRALCPRSCPHGGHKHSRHNVSAAWPTCEAERGGARRSEAERGGARRSSGRGWRRACTDGPRRWVTS